MNNDVKFLLLGVVIGYLLSAVLFGLLFGIVPAYHEAEYLCEETLPRDRHCEMYFKPVEIQE